MGPHRQPFGRMEVGLFRHQPRACQAVTKLVPSLTGLKSCPPLHPGTYVPGYRLSRLRR